MEGASPAERWCPSCMPNETAACGSEDGLRVKCFLLEQNEAYWRERVKEVVDQKVLEKEQALQRKMLRHNADVTERYERESESYKMVAEQLRARLAERDDACSVLEAKLSQALTELEIGRRMVRDLQLVVKSKGVSTCQYCRRQGTLHPTTF